MKLRKIKHVDVPSYIINKKKRRRKRVLRLVKFLVLTALFTTTIIYAAMSPYFNITGFKVKESLHYDESTLISFSGIRKGSNGFKTLVRSGGRFYLLRFGASEKAIMDNCPYVKNGKVKYLLPSTVYIEVEERTAAAILSLNDVYLLIDREGYMLEWCPEPPDIKLPVIKGIEADSPKLGQKIENSKEALSSAFKVFDTIKDVDDLNGDRLSDIIDYVDVSDLYNVSFSLQSRIIVNLGKMDDLHYKISTASTIFNRNIKRTEKGKLDFSKNTDPVFTPENGG